MFGRGKVYQGIICRGHVGEELGYGGAIFCGAISEGPSEEEPSQPGLSIGQSTKSKT